MILQKIKRALRIIKIELKRSYLLLVMPERMEIQRLQILAGILDKKNTRWNGIPSKRYTFQDVLDCFKNKPKPVYVDMTAEESLEFVLGKQRTEELTKKQNKNGDNKKEKRTSKKETTKESIS